VSVLYEDFLLYRTWTPYAQVVMADNPLLYWRLEVPGGATAFDSSGNSRSAPQTSLSAYSSPPLDTGQAARFDGTGRIYSSSYNPWSGAISCEAIILTDNYASGGNKTIFGSDAANPQFLIANTGNVFFFYSGLSNIGWTGKWTQDGVWKHIVCCFSPTNINNCKLYINGVDQGAPDLGSTGAYGTTGNVTVGARAAVPASFLVGGGDEFALYSGTLSAARVAAHFAALPSLNTPVVTIQSGPTASKISRVVGKDSTNITWSSDMDFTDYQIRVVSNSTDGVTAGTVVETNQTPPGGGIATNSYMDSITDDELVAASGSDGSKLLKVFVKSYAGAWSA
jgi:hypothetical protein